MVTVLPRAAYAILSWCRRVANQLASHVSKRSIRNGTIFASCLHLLTIP